MQTQLFGQKVILLIYKTCVRDWEYCVSSFADKKNFSSNIFFRVLDCEFLEESHNSLSFLIISINFLSIYYISALNFLKA